MENQIYKEEDFLNANKQKKTNLIIYFVVLGLYIIFGALALVYYMRLPYKSSLIVWVKVVVYSVTAIFFIFSYVFLLIHYKRIGRYCKMLNGIRIGEVINTVGSFYEYNESLEVKDGCDFKSIIFKQWNTKKQEFYDRKVLVDVEKQLPEFQKEENIKYYTHANILVGFDRV